MAAYGTEPGIRYKVGNLGSQIPLDRLNDANNRATSRVNNETGGRTWSVADGDDWQNVVLATEYYAAAELKSPLSAYQDSRAEDIKEAQRLIQNIIGTSVSESEENNPMFVETSDYGTNPLNPQARHYPWNLEGYQQDELTRVEDIT
jgi:hypothetical protein